MVVVDGAVDVVLRVEEVGVEVVAVTLVLLLPFLPSVHSPASSLLLLPVLSVAGVAGTWTGTVEGPGWPPVTGTSPVTEGPGAMGDGAVAALGAT